MNHILQLAAISMAAITIASCGGKKDEKTTLDAQKLPEKVKLMKLEKQSIAKEIELSATLEGYETMNVSPSVTGHIEHIYVQVGSRVSRGSMLVRMDQTQLNTNKINVASTKVELDRVAALRQSGSISEQTYDQTKAAYDQLVESGKFLNVNTFVRAPFSGIISAKNYEDGEMYSGQPILTLTQINHLKAIINIPESYFPLVHKGMRVNVFSEIYPNTAFPATIEIVYPTIDAASHTFQAKLTIPNGSEKIRPGMYVRTTLALGQVDALVVPYQSVLKLTGSNDRYVFVNDGGKARRVSVTLGQRFNDQIEIIPVKANDIKEGDELVVVGQAKLVDKCALDIVGYTTDANESISSPAPTAQPKQAATTAKPKPAPAAQPKQAATTAKPKPAPAAQPKQAATTTPQQTPATQPASAEQK
jgi:RND family efflux transporter MFP subunit